MTANGISASFYHAGLGSDSRSDRQAKWKSGQIRVMVCTNAFGMGIDKPDVRFVVHFDVPDSPEAYFRRQDAVVETDFAALQFCYGMQLT